MCWPLNGSRDSPTNHTEAQPRGAFPTAVYLADIDDDDGPPALRGALAAAASQCQRAANELGKLVEDLHIQVHTGGKARRKIRAARVVLQKEMWAAHEKRLASAVQMLMMASQMYGLAQQRYLLQVPPSRSPLASRLTTDFRDLQRSQPNVIVTQILATLPPREVQPSDSESSSQQFHQRGPRTRSVWYFRPDLRLGMADITGSLELQYGRKRAVKKCKEAIPVFGFRIQLPKWLSTRTLDSLLQQSHAGWNYNLRASNYYPRGSEIWKLAKDIMLDISQQDSLQELQCLIADGRLSMHDKLQWVVGEGWFSLMDVSDISNSEEVKASFTNGQFSSPFLSEILSYTHSSLSTVSA